MSKKEIQAKGSIIALTTVFALSSIFNNFLTVTGNAAPLTINAPTAPNALVGLNQTGIWSNAGTVGGQNIDLHGTVTSIDNSIRLAMVSSGNDPSIQLDSGGFGYGGSAAGSATVRWEVFEAGTANPVKGEPSWTVLDIDGSGTPNTIETITPDVEGLLSYELSSTSALVDTSSNGQLTVSGTDSDSATPPPGPDRDSAAVTFNWGERYSWEITYTNHLNGNGRVFNHDGNGEFTFAGATDEVFLPQLDLDGDDDSTSASGSANYIGYHINNNVAVPITDSGDTSISNVTGNLDGLTATLTNAEAGDELTVDGVVGTSGTVPGTSITFTISGGVVTLSGAANATDYTTALEAIRFNTTAGTTALSDRVLQIAVSVPAGGSSLTGNLAISTISFTQDSDGDLVPDAFEVVQGTSTSDPLNYLDTDGDLVPDYIEDQDGTSNSDDGDFTDEDNGGTPDYVEITRYTNEGLPVTDPTTGNEADDNRDLDDDGQSDYEELKAGTNPQAAVVITPTGGGVEVSEDGLTTDTVEYELMSQPTDTVVVTLAADPNYDYGSGFNSPHVLTFITSNWSSAQTITVTASDNDVDEDSNTYTGSPITYTVTSTGDTDYDGVAVPDTEVTVTNDDQAGVDVDDSVGISVTEDGANGSFDVVLESEPTSNVVVTVSSSDTGAATTSVSSLTFTPANWNTPQSVSISPVTDDDVVDESVTITFSVDDSNSDDVYDVLSDITRIVTVTDSDSAGFTVTPNTDVSINEGSTNTNAYSVVLDQQPQSNVVIDISSALSGVIIDTPSVTFTPANWNTPQDVSVTSAEDDNVVSEQDTVVTFAVNNGTSDDDFDGLSQNRQVDVVDSDTATIVVSPNGITVNENAGTEDFTVVLGAQPSSNVVIDLTSGDEDEATVLPATLTFTPANWNQPQTVTTTGVNDDVDRDDSLNITVSINEASSDDDFDTIGDETVTVTLTNDDSAGFTMTPATVSVGEGSTETFNVVLTSQPESDVVVDLSSDDNDAASISASSLTFTPSDWNTSQLVTISGEEDDDVVDESVTITGTINEASSDDTFDTVSDQSVSVTVADNDSADIVVSPTGVTVNENAGSGDFTIVLSQQPTSNVVIDLSSGDTDEATVSPTTVTFTPSNWDQPQTVTITGVNDVNITEDTTDITVTVNDLSSDDDWDGVNDTVTVDLTNDDVDSDGDLVPDEQEVLDSTNENDAEEYIDSDGDLVPDYVETELQELEGGSDTDANDSSDFVDEDNGTVPSYVETVLYPNVGLAATDPTLLADDTQDTDGDLVTDYNELLQNTDPQDSATYTDSDGDLVPDDVEASEGTSANDPLEFLDSDDDLVPDYVETVLESNNGLPSTSESDPTDYNDSDSDLVPDYVETTYQANSSGVATNPQDAAEVVDTDGGDLPDYIETVYLPNISLPALDANDLEDDYTDSDGDGVPDIVELTSLQPTDPANINDNIDSDSDGHPDYVETEAGSDPNDATSLPTDSDGDGVPDVVETLLGNDLNDNNSTPVDSDNDGHPDYIEMVASTDVLGDISTPVDTDGDLVPDEVESANGTDTNDGSDYLDADNDIVPSYVESQDGTSDNNQSDFIDDDTSGTPNYVETVLYPILGAPATDPNDGSDDDIDTDNGQKSDYQELKDGSDIFEITDDTDADIDNIPDTVEQGAPNNGDGNGDGIPDFVQSNVSSNVNAVTGAYSTLVTAGDCTDISKFEFTAEASLSAQDESSIFELGLHDFAVDCSAAGGVAEISMYWDQVYDTSTWSYKKFDTITNTYTDITDSVTNSNEVVGDGEVTISRYSVTDGGALDQDGSANGAIVDPAGPAIADPANNMLLRTGGQKFWNNKFFGIGVITSLIAFSGVIADKFKRKV